MGADTRNVLSDADIGRITCGFASGDMEMNWADMLCFFGACERAPHLRWVQIAWVGFDFPFCSGLRESAGAEFRNGTEFVATNAVGSNALPVATSVMAALLCL